MKNLVQLAKLFNQFIELESSFVRAEDIKAISKVDITGEKGIEVITPYGTFRDSTDFDIFKVRIQDMLEALKVEEKIRPVEAPMEARIVPMKSEPKIDRVEAGSNQSYENQIREVTITLSGNGSTGTLFDDPSYKVVNRDQLAVLAPDGVQIAGGTSGGTVVGEVISGIVYESGKYTFAAKEYQGNSITVRFQIQKR